MQMTTRMVPWLCLGTCGVFAGGAQAVDLSVDTITVIQAVQYGNTPLIAKNATMIRAKIDVTDSGGSVADVDALIRVWDNGVELEGSPFYSINGPISAPLNPQLTNLNHTINFTLVLPESDDIDFEIEVNPFQTVVETNYSNNTRTKLNQSFVCKDVTEVVYVPVNYTPGGGLPTASLIEPGIGDGFLRAIGTPAEWNYHKSPLPTFTWTQNINNSNGALLNALSTIRTNTLPANGYPVPAYVYGWLPGNPFSGNGQANGIPGTAAFGNTQASRHQRTMAHEIGHCVGLSHNNATINTIGIDVEHHLKDTQNLSQLFTANKYDIMVAGQLTNTAFVNANSYTTFLNNSNLTCPGANDEAAPAEPVLFLTGLIETDTRAITLDHAMWIARGLPTPTNRAGDLRIDALDDAGRLLHSVSITTGTTVHSCAVHEAAPYPNSPFEAVLPAHVAGVSVAGLRLVDVASGAVLAERFASAHPPVVEGLSVGLADGVIPGVHDGADLGHGALSGIVRVEWAAFDADGDDLRFNVLYSRDKGVSWLPLTTNTASNVFEFDSAQVPGSLGSDGLIRVVASDGLSNGIVTSPPMALGGNGAPEVFLITPNQSASVPQHASVVFHATAWDPEDQLLGDADLEWKSNIDGVFGQGRIMTFAGLSPGTHTITVVATDSNNESRSDFITLTVTEREIGVVGPDADFNNDGVVDAADLAILLAGWSDGAIGDLNGDGTIDPTDLAILLSLWGPVGG